MVDYIARSLANWATSLRSKELPDNVLLKAEDCILDAIAVAIPGILTVTATPEEVEGKEMPIHTRSDLEKKFSK